MKSVLKQFDNSIQITVGENESSGQHSARKFEKKRSVTDATK